jgi:tetratricopeptide (TPR) repeat protein
VIIDHIGTSLGELLIMGVPFILLIDHEFITFPDEFTLVKQKLISCGILHSSAESAINHLSRIYSSVEIWWNSDVVQSAVNLLKEISLSHSSKTVDYLLSLINAEVNGGLTNEIVERKRNKKSSISSSDSSTPSYDTKENEIEKAEKLIVENELSLAEKKLIKLSRKYPHEIRILNDIALLKIYDEKHFEAKKILDNILENNEHYLPAVENQIYLRILIQQKILESNALPAGETISFAEKLIELNELSLAEKILVKVLSADSSNIDALNDLAVIKILQKDYSAAESFILDVVKVDPKNEMARNNYNYLLLEDSTENNVEEEKIFGQFDFPLNNYEISGRLHLSFWMLKNFPEEPLIRIYLDNKRLWRFERFKRDDVLKYYPHLEIFNPYPGVVFWLDTNKMLDGEHELKWFASNKGKILQFAETKIYINNNVIQHQLEKA